MKQIGLVARRAVSVSDLRVQSYEKNVKTEWISRKKHRVACPFLVKKRWIATGLFFMKNLDKIA